MVQQIVFVKKESRFLKCQNCIQTQFKFIKNIHFNPNKQTIFFQFQILFKIYVIKNRLKKGV